MKSFLALAAVSAACGVIAAVLGKGSAAALDEADIRARLAAYARVDLQAPELATLPASERDALAALVRSVEA
ncbi:MAG TPA: hypothetical protein VFQ07_06105, partial [Candidatus Polarisedimenticolia bacterium]|nr:hypothetical protein [Candidatus Polarisedimenticolia bacterium]